MVGTSDRLQNEVTYFPPNLKVFIIGPFMSAQLKVYENTSDPRVE